MTPYEYLGRLSPVRFTSVKANIDLSNVTINARSGDFNAVPLARVINTQTINTLVLQTWLDRAGTIMCLGLPDIASADVRFKSAEEVNISILCQYRPRGRFDKYISQSWG